MGSEFLLVEDWHRDEVIATVIRELNEMRDHSGDEFDETPFVG
jgi:hypothetical protein